MTTSVAAPPPLQLLLDPYPLPSPALLVSTNPTPPPPFNADGSASPSTSNNNSTTPISTPSSGEATPPTAAGAATPATVNKSKEQRKEEKRQRKEEKKKRKHQSITGIAATETPPASLHGSTKDLSAGLSPASSSAAAAASSEVPAALGSVIKSLSNKRQKLTNTQMGDQNPYYVGGDTARGGRPIGKAPVPILADGFSLPLAADSASSSNAGSYNRDPNSAQSQLPILDYSDAMVLKPDHALRPIIVLPTGYIYLDMNNPFSKPAADFLVTIAEPVSRPENIHEFQLTVFSLYAAVGAGVSIEDLLRNLNKFSKNEIPKRLEALLQAHGCAFGRVKLVLRDNKYYLEAATQEDLEYMLSHPTIAEARIRNSIATRQIRTKASAQQPRTDANLESAEAPTLDPSTLGFRLTEASDPNATKSSDDLQTAAAGAAASVDPGGTATTTPAQGGGSRGAVAAAAPTHRAVYLFEVMSDRVGRVKECALTELKRPLLSEYDFRRDQKNPSLDIALKPVTRIRYYQERALRKMFSNGRARSGIIVLPCGAGKTLTGITAATTIRKSAMILTSSSVAVDQWRRSFIEFTTVDPNNVVGLTSDRKQDLPANGGAAILISTYTMMSYSGRRSDAAERILQQIREREWGLLIFDEVQFAPAPAFRKVNDLVRSHCKLGLTATLVREDDLIHDLQWLIGPKLYEANWLELQEAGFLAKVQVSEVWCPMTADFYKEYLISPHSKQRKLWVCNPNKLRVCEYLLRFHEARNDKIIVFSDNLFALKEVAFTLKKPFISGEVGMQERMIILNKFKTTSTLNTIFLSKVGDNAIDIPCANVVIQISFNFASRRQEAQRLGRILRPKPKAGDDEFNAFFYSLVSKDTQEMLYADKRQQFIIDQGYAYKVLPISVFPMENETLVFDDRKRQKDLLDRILATSDAAMDIESDDVVLNDSGVDAKSIINDDEGNEDAGYSIRKTSISKISGMNTGMMYNETRRRANIKKDLHTFFT